MPQSVANRVAFGVCRESVVGTTPATPTWSEVLRTTGGLTSKPKTKESATSVSDRMLPDLILVNKEQDGPLGFESSFMPARTWFDLMLDSGFYAPWVVTSEKDNDGTAASVITAVASTTYTVTATSPAWAQDCLVRATGFTNSANNKVFAAGAASSSTSVVHSSGVVEASPAAAARLKWIGMQARSAADIVAVTVGGNGITATTSTSFVTMGLVAGMWVTLGTNAARAGGTDAYSFAITTANNGRCRISAVTATTLKFDIVPVGWAADAATGKTIRIYWGDYLRNGTTELTNSVEQRFLDMTSIGYIVYRGAHTEMLKWSFAAEEIVTGEVSIRAMSTTENNGTRFTGSLDRTAPINEILNCASHVAVIAEAGVAITGTPGNYVLRMDIGIDNTLRSLPADGVFGYIGINAGRSKIGGNIDFYLADLSIKAKALAGTGTSLYRIMQDTVGHEQVWDLPSIKLETADAATGGVDDDNFLKCGYRALKYTPSSGSAYSIHYQRNELSGTAA